MFEESDFIFFQSRFRFKYLFRSIIQRFTGVEINIKERKYKFEHCARYSKGYIYECLGSAFWDTKKKGCIKTLADERIKYNKSYTKVFIIRLNEQYSKTVSDYINECLESQLGKKYTAIQATMSYLENFIPSKLKILFLRKSKIEEFFCSKLAVYPEYKIGKIKEIPRTLTPNELASILLNKGANIIEL